MLFYGIEIWCLKFGAYDLGFKKGDPPSSRTDKSNSPKSANDLCCRIAPTQRIAFFFTLSPIPYTLPALTSELNAMSQPQHKCDSDHMQNPPQRF